MTESYTVFWTIDRWLAALSAGHKPLPVGALHNRR